MGRWVPALVVSGDTCPIKFKYLLCLCGYELAHNTKFFLFVVANKCYPSIVVVMYYHVQVERRDK